MDIFLLCGSPGRTNGHLCFGVLALVSGSADGGTVSGVADLAAIAFNGAPSIDISVQLPMKMPPCSGQGWLIAGVVLIECSVVGLRRKG